MTVGQILAEATKTLEKSSTTPRLDALVLMARYLQIPTANLMAHDDLNLNRIDHEAINKLIKKRFYGLPVAYITNQVEFYGLDLFVSPAVLVPRPETEALAEAVITKAPKGTFVIDIGCGSGALLVAIGSNRPDLYLTATDISSSALEVAKLNLKNHRIKATFHKSNLFDAIEAKFNIVIANLPYLPMNHPITRSAAFEPQHALFAGTDGLDLYRRFFKQLPGHCQKDAVLVLECLPAQTEAIDKLAVSANFKHAERLNDFCHLYLKN